MPAVCSGGVTSAVNQDGDTVTQNRFKWKHFDMLSGQSSIGDVSDVDFARAQETRLWFREASKKYLAHLQPKRT